MLNLSLIDNQRGNTLKNAIVGILHALKSNSDGVCTLANTDIRIAVGFFSLSGFMNIFHECRGAKTVKILLGAEVLDSYLSRGKNVGEEDNDYMDRILNRSLRNSDQYVKRERDTMPFSKISTEYLHRLKKDVVCGKIVFKRYEKTFLHAKTYIFTSEEKTGSKAGNDTIVVGSSNLTMAGLIANCELNLASGNNLLSKCSVEWFDNLWKDAEEYDIASIIDDMLHSKTPWEVFVRVLWVLYGKEIIEDQSADFDLPLTSFQKHGVSRVIRLINETGGAIVADEVGLGKTFIAGEVLNVYRKNRQKALLLCPASLRDSTWKSFSSKYDLFVECKSFEELAMDERLRDDQENKIGRQVLDHHLDEYQLIIIDEAHNYRNPDAPMRAGVLRKLLRGAKRDLLLLTATPVNNSLWDLHQLIQYFIKQDAHFSTLGIPSIKTRFTQAMKQDPSNLSPDLLYPIIDATTVKRTRQFVKKHYKNDKIVMDDGEHVPIVFPKPVAVSVRYNMDASMPGVFEKVERALSPDSVHAITFARYRPNTYKCSGSEIETHARMDAMVGLLRSGLLKRFESSTHSFGVTVNRMATEHLKFLNFLDSGYILCTSKLREITTDDEWLFEDLQQLDDEVSITDGYDVKNLRLAVKSDRLQLLELYRVISGISMRDEQKLKVLTHELTSIVKQSHREAIDATDERQLRKVIIFTTYADTAEWIHGFLKDQVRNLPDLECYQDRMAIVTGSKDLSEISREKAIQGFAPESMEVPRDIRNDKYDLLISTDVLAEGVNLQQCRNIINFDLPWNPMRLVQRHGRIDRIKSKHDRVYLRTIFPEDRVERLLALEERIHLKLAMAARSIGVEAPIEGAAQGQQVFTETKEEIERLMREDSSLYERGGTVNASQTGEEYRQALRMELTKSRSKVENMPWKSGSIMKSESSPRGIFFHAVAGERSFLRFVCADQKWQLLNGHGGVLREIGTCLRIIECNRDTPLEDSEFLKEKAYKFWETARKSVYDEWEVYTDPANLQPKVRRLNREVAEYIRKFVPSNVNEEHRNMALDIVESPWSMREENMLREWFKSETYSGKEKTKYLIEQILDIGIDPAIAPEPLPQIMIDEIKLLCWMAINSDIVFNGLAE